MGANLSWPISSIWNICVGEHRFNIRILHERCVEVSKDRNKDDNAQIKMIK